jgi:polyisoprenyl-phosphate glycosyltransferase
MAHLSVVVPVYEAEECLHELYRRLRAALEPVTPDFEIVLVEDGGRDGSWRVIRELSAKDPRVKGLRFSRNFGQHYGITAGLDHCDGDWVVVMDCDLQDRPEEIPHLYRKAREGFDVVLARRRHRTDGPSKLLASRFFYRLFSWLSEIDYDKDVGNFRIVSRKVVENLKTMRERLRFFGGLVHWLGFPTASVDVEHAARYKGETAYDFKRLWKLASEAVIAYSDKPLRLAVKFGFAMAAVALLAGVYLFWRALADRSPMEGWSTLIVTMYFLGGIIIAILGVIGIYLGKAFDEVKKRPLYVVADRTFHV